MGKRARRRAKAVSGQNPTKSDSVDKKVGLHAESGVDRVFLAVIACFVLSGFAALIYQTAWLRQFSIAFGTSELAVVTVLAAYMAGLALGAIVAARYLNQVKRPVLVYGLLEAGIAISALAVPWLLMGASALYTVILGDQAVPPDADSVGQSIFYLISGFLILAIPTGFMGATLPLLIRHAVKSDTQLGPRVAYLYASNTVGAVIGTLIAGFVLLPMLGLRATIWVGVGVNIVVFIIAARLARYLQPIEENDTSLPQEDGSASFFHSCIKPCLATPTEFARIVRSVFSGQTAWILPIMLVSGSTAFFYEVLWTRLINHVLGGSIYAFATMLASFLSGIAIGGALAGRFARTREQAAWAFAIVQIAIGVFSAAVYAWMEYTIPSARDFLTDAFFAAIVMLPSTIFIGATLPLAIRILAQNEIDAGTCTARVYSWNTVGGIIGAVLAGFYLIPLLEFRGSIRLAVFLNLSLCLFTLIIITPRKPNYIGIISLVTLALVFGYQPDRPMAVLNASVFNNNNKPDEIDEVYFGVGRSATVLMAAREGWMDLRTNGLSEAIIEAKGSPPTLQNQR
ncbi:MAG: MFS transporter [Gammaproteobacteria bacterium]|nr:MFS transporter [Gammaproteobacteria bacterium]